ncbi:hypothetical protein E2562_020146 [Oryza meyeriana var. granulata]|uniref:DUF1618 domain-containing protein n=1 Tax=Oryza meyeriana var. granulata TaxID=110450 RepID=A0A6G1BMD1_9ORYZ|nr:hypothetical protein E2562_020146 [Oryza meyeriana var. granulata]
MSTKNGTGYQANPRSKPYRLQQQRFMLDENIGFLYHDAGEFMVVDITTCMDNSVELCILNHHASPGSGKEMDEPQWRVKRLQMHPASIRMMGGRKLGYWENDVVLPLHNRYLCRLLQGHYLQYFSYIPLPEEAMHGHRIDEYEPDPARCVSVSGTGLIRLICIDNAIGSKRKTRPAFTIKSWSLVDIHKSRWVHNFAMEADEFCNLCAGFQRLPHVTPIFPLVSLVDPHAISFLLEDNGNDLYWMIVVDMRKKSLLSPPALYINREEEEEGFCSDRCKPWKPFDGHYFIPSCFSCYLD